MFPLISDTGIALLGGLLLFLTPVNIRKGEFLMNWETAKRAPWDVFLLFGGGLSLASMIEKQGVAEWIGTLFAGAEAIPLLLLVPAAMAANCAFMLPVGTPPNAIVFGSGRIPLPEMAKAGIWLNLTFVLLIVGMVYALGPFVFGIEFGVLPDWASNLPPA